MAYNAPFVISEANSSASHMQMMALSFMALRLNVSPPPSMPSMSFCSAT